MFMALILEELWIFHPSSDQLFKVWPGKEYQRKIISNKLLSVWNEYSTGKLDKCSKDIVIAITTGTTITGSDGSLKDTNTTYAWAIEVHKGGMRLVMV